MGMNKERFESIPLKAHTEGNEAIFRRTFGNIETLHCFDTYQMDDYTNIDYLWILTKNVKEEKPNFRKIVRKPLKWGKSF